MRNEHGDNPVHTEESVSIQWLLYLPQQLRKSTLAFQSLMVMDP